MVKPNNNPIIPDDHPRSLSLHYRHKLVEGMHAKVVTPTGLCAHGRGEAYDYILGEKTTKNADNAMYSAIATILLAKYPVISINGNVAALVPKEIVKLSKITGALLEINLFYQEDGRIEAIEKILRENGADTILGLGDVDSKSIGNLSSNRRIVDPRGIFKADVVLVPLEDGDRTENLVKQGKTVITIDLNPLSRTSQKADITIVDNITRCIPRMIEIATEIKNFKTEKFYNIKNKFNQKENLNNSLKFMIEYLKSKTK